MYTILKGPYGNYIDINDTSKKIKKKSLKVPLKDIEDDKIKDLTLDKVKELIKIGMETKSNRFKKKTDKTDKVVDADKADKTDKTDKANKTDKEDKPKEQSRVKKPKNR